MFQFYWQPIQACLTVSLICLALSGCASHAHQDGQTTAFSTFPEQPSIFISANYGPDGKLWRVASSKKAVFVDYSVDDGQTFSPPLQINPAAQTIKSSSENRPSIALDSKNHIYVTYAAEGQKPASLYLSTSIDNGKSFSTPQYLSEKATSANTFQATLAINQADQAYIFWHDDRDRTHYQQLGNSIYYTLLSNGQPSNANLKASDVLCECCRLALAFDIDQQPVVLGRFIYDQTARDHGLLKPINQVWQTWRVTDDDWRIEACPEQGPALSISATGEYHMAWHTQGNVRKGLFYAFSTDHGQHFSPPLRIGNFDRLASNPAVFATGKQVAIAWTEFNGESSQLLLMQSNDQGQTWQANRQIASTQSAADRPFFLTKDPHSLFLAWTTKQAGFRLFKISQ